MLTVLGAVAGLVAAGAVGQRAAELRDARRYPRPGTLVRAGDTTLHTIVEGSGPVVLVDSGLGGSNLEWGAVAADLASDFTVVRYDRPGLAWSPASRCDRRARAAATRILGLLDALNVPDPVILVGHSLGGVHVRLAAALAPDRVRALVLVDPSDEGMLEIVETSRAAAVSRGVIRVVSWLAPIGVGRLAGGGFARLAMAEARQPLDPAQRRAARLSGLLTSRTVRGLRAVSAEHDALGDSLRQLLEVNEPDRPVTVISAAAPSKDQRTADARSQMDAMHTAYVSSRPRARQVFAERSGHLVPFDQPELVSQCVREAAKR